MIFGSMCPHTPNFNVGSEFHMGLCPVTFVEITSQISEQSAANIEIGGKGAAWPMLSHSNAGVQKNGFGHHLVYLRNYFGQLLKITKLFPRK